MKTKYPRAAALAVAKELCDYLKPFCVPDRLKVCGSLRRMKKEVGDVEVLFIGKIEDRQEGLFDKKPFDLAEEAIGKLLLNKVIEKRLNSRGFPTWGPLNKLAVHCKSGIPVDLFATVETHWWGSVVIRTGCKEFNLKLIESASKRGLDLHAYGPSDFTHSSMMTEISCATEEQVFQLAGIPYLQPHERV
jgi:DNA polymerase/3'-5' exonuclease PolX